MSTQEISENHDLWKLIVLSLVLALIGRLYKSMRGATLGFDGETIRLTFFFERSPTEQEVESLQDVEAEIVSCHKYQSDLVLSVVPVSESLHDKVDNWGWVFLRSEG
ncbi:hypothetical protein ACQKFE_08515 [Stutzerimonas stutzeri]|uniref:hypothetical protein n=1 Tax=Stutzerimonas stutzeri TaxID=316 RepID=UPI003D019610